MAERVAGGPTPPADPVRELEKELADCRHAMDSVYAAVAQGRLSEESVLGLRAALDDRARTASESLRSCRRQIESVVPPARRAAAKGPATR